MSFDPSGIGGDVGQSVSDAVSEVNESEESAEDNAETDDTESTSPDNSGSSGGGSSSSDNSSSDGGSDSGSSNVQTQTSDDILNAPTSSSEPFDGSTSSDTDSSSSSNQSESSSGSSSSSSSGDDGSTGPSGPQTQTANQMLNSAASPSGPFGGGKSGGQTGTKSNTTDSGSGGNPDSQDSGTNEPQQDPIRFKNTVQFERAVAERISERTGADITRFDVESSLEEQPDGRDISAQLNESGRQKVTQDFEQDTAERLSNQSGANFSADDIEVETRQQNGETVRVATLAESGQKIAATETASAEIGQTLASPVTSVAAPTTGQTRPADIGDGQVSQTESSSGGAAADTSSGSGRATGGGQRANDAGETDPFSGTVSAAEDGLSEVAQVASGDESTRVEFRGDGSALRDVAENAPTGDSEQFGDFAIRGPTLSEDTLDPNTAEDGNIIQRRRVEDVLAQESALFQSGVVDPVADFSSGVARSEVGAVGEALANPGETYVDVGKGLYTLNQNLGDDPGQTVNRLQSGDLSDIQPDAGPGRGAQQRAAQTRGIVEGAGTFADVPGLALTVKEAAEFGGAAVSETASGDGGEFAAEAAGAGAVATTQTAQFAQRNPNRFGGQLVGGALASGGVISAGRRVGGSTGERVAAIGVQPGEEVALAAGRQLGGRAARAANLVGDVDARRSGSESVDQTTQTQFTRGPRDRATFSEDQVDGVVTPETTPGTTTPVDIERADVEARLDEPATVEIERENILEGGTETVRRETTRRPENIEDDGGVRDVRVIERGRLNSGDDTLRIDDEPDIDPFVGGPSSDLPPERPTGLDAETVDRRRSEVGNPTAPESDASVRSQSGQRDVESRLDDPVGVEIERETLLESGTKTVRRETTRRPENIEDDGGVRDVRVIDDGDLNSRSETDNSGDDASAENSVAGVNISGSQLREFLRDDDASLQFRDQRQGPEARVDGRTRGVDNLEFGPALEQRQFRDFEALESRGGINDAETQQSQRLTDPADSLSGPRERLRRSQEQQATDGSVDINEGRSSIPGVGPTATAGGFLASAQTPGLDIDVGETPGIDTSTGQSTRTDVGVGAELGARIDGRVDQDTRLDTRQETRQETRFETRQEARSESRTETRQETRSETRSETRGETRQETRRELFGERERDAQDASSSSLFDLDGAASEDITDFLNPLTGERLETDN